MKIGIPREIKIKENRVACTPGGARMLAKDGHEVWVEKDAGAGSGFYDDQYIQAGAHIVPLAEEAWSADLVLKVKEPIPSEYKHLRPGLVLFTFLHLAADKELTQQLIGSGTTAMAYETIQVGHRLPLLEPMSEIAGRMSSLVGAYYLSNTRGGKGVLLGGVPGVLPGRVLVLGGGTAGVNAARIAAGLGAEVIILEVDLEKMRLIDATWHNSLRTLYSDQQNLLDLLPSVDLLIGAVLLPGAKAPKLINRTMLKQMKPGSVLVDIAIDQGGCAETSKPTTHDDPVYVEEDIVHYCVTNMPGAYARTSTQALTNATFQYALQIANLGLTKALVQSPELVGGLNTFEGRVTCRAVSEAHELPYLEWKGVYH